MVSDRLDGVHQNIVDRLSPIEIGGVTAQLSSPEHSLEVFSHEIQLVHLGEQRDRIRLRAHFSGEARLVAAIDVAGVPAQLEDRVVVPDQELELEGIVHLAREADGYRLVTLDIPPTVEIALQSSLGNQLELLCRGLAAVLWGGTDCQALGRALERVTIPLPEPGSTYYVAASQLTAQERRQLDAFLEAR